MSGLVLPSLYSATNLARHPSAAAVNDVAPWRGILAMEPDITVLYAKSLLLTEANYCVTRVNSDRQLLTLRSTKAVPLAILSDRLGPRLLGTVAETIRRQWPSTRILILGQVPRVFDDYLYDEHICRDRDSQQVLDKLEGLYKGMWNRRANIIDWRATRPALHSSQRPTPESDPTKAVSQAPTKTEPLRDMPTEVGIPVTRAN